MIERYQSYKLLSFMDKHLGLNFRKKLTNVFS